MLLIRFCLWRAWSSGKSSGSRISFFLQAGMMTGITSARCNRIKRSRIRRLNIRIRWCTNLSKVAVHYTGQTLVDRIGSRRDDAGSWSRSIGANLIVRIVIRSTDTAIFVSNRHQQAQPLPRPAQTSHRQRAG